MTKPKQGLAAFAEENPGRHCRVCDLPQRDEIDEWARAQTKPRPAVVMHWLASVGVEMPRGPIVGHLTGRHHEQPG